MDKQLKLEKYWPYAMATLGFAIATFFTPLALVMKVEMVCASSVITVMAILLGFTTTSMTVILAESPQKGEKSLRSSPVQYKLFVDYHTDSITLGVVASIISLVLMLAPDYHWAWLIRCIYGLWIGTSVCALAFFIRIVFLLRRLLFWKAQP